jgi:hypothetical protein
MEFPVSDQGYLAASGDLPGSGGIWQTKDGGGTWVRQ